MATFRDGLATRCRRGTERVGEIAGRGSGRQYAIGSRVVVEGRQISEGGFSFVCLAYEIHTHEKFVVKKILCQDNAGLNMARREVAILEGLPPHPNLVHYYGFTIVNADEHSKVVIILLEFCSGGRLSDIIDRHKGWMSEGKICAIFTDVCKAVAFLHSQSPPVQHRDVKPENILLGAEGVFKLCDFGSWSDVFSDPSLLDKKAEALLKEEIERYTTMMYRPPEMIHFFQQHKICEKVDIWMLGCILYTLMFWKHPFQDECPLAIANARYNFPSEPRYSENMEDLVRWLLAQNPGDRPTAQQVINVLNHVGEMQVLPLPSALIEQKERQRRLYEAQQVSLPKHTGKKSEQAKKRKPSKRSWPKALDFPDPFGPCSEAMDDTTPWPSTVVPEPSRAWATFKTDTELSASGRSTPCQSASVAPTDTGVNCDPWGALTPSPSQSMDGWNPFGMNGTP